MNGIWRQCSARWSENASIRCELGTVGARGHTGSHVAHDPARDDDITWTDEGPAAGEFSRCGAMHPHLDGKQCERRTNGLGNHLGLLHEVHDGAGRWLRWSDRGQMYSEPDAKAADSQVGGSHYQRAIQPWDIWDVWDLNPWQAQVIKYVLRAGHKEGVPAVEDYRKARHMLDYLIEREERDNGV